MTRRARLAGALALWGFLACVSWSTGLVPTRCCAASCTSGSSCDSTVAKSSAKPDTALGLASAPARVATPDVRVLQNREASECLPSLSPAFRRPMRN